MSVSAHSSRGDEDIYNVTYPEDDPHEIYEDLCSLRRRVSVQVRRGRRGRRRAYQIKRYEYLSNKVTNINQIKI